jgi:nitrite reductase (NADH) large subunit
MHIAVVGGGRSGFACIQRLREISPDCQITLIDRKNALFDRLLLKEALAKNDLAAARLFSQAYFDEHRIEFIHDRVVRVNPYRKRVFLKYADRSIQYDKVIVATGMESQAEAVSGLHKEGVYSFWESNIAELKTAFGIYREIVAGVSGEEAAVCIRELARLCGKRATVVGAASIEQTCAGEELLTFVKDAHVTEIIGEGAVKAVRLSNGKFLAADIFLHEPELAARLSVFSEYPELFAEGKLLVRDDGALIEANNTYVIGSAAQDISRVDAARKAAESVLGAAV